MSVTSTLARGLTALLVVVAAGTPQPAAADAPAQHGYWSDLPAGSTPDGGLEVAANGFDRVPASIAAIRAAGQVQTITLVEASSVVAPGVDPVTILACPITAPWEAAERGALADAPAYDCSTTFDTLERVEADGVVQWVAEVDRFVRDGVVDVMFVTGPGRGPFTVSFQPPDANTVTVATPEPGPVTAAPVPTTTPSVESAPRPAPAFAPPALASSSIVTVDPAQPVDDGDVEVAVAPRQSTGRAALDLGGGRTAPDATGRAPIALAAAALAIGAWFWRYRTASGRSADHPLAGGLGGRVAAGFAGASAVVAADEEQTS